MLARLRQRDPATLTAAVQEHTRPLYRTARSMGFSEAESEDLVQDVFTVFLATLDRFEGRSQVRTWLFGILHNRMRELRRALQREESYDPVDAEFDALFTAYGHWISPLEDLERTLESRDIGRTLDDCLGALPLQQREVFLLREVEGLDSKDICNNLQISNTHLGVLIHRARHRLRECMKGKGWR
jgi:RNA polymerase sigma-70 factor (ECF subfamily)